MEISLFCTTPTGNPLALATRPAHRRACSVDMREERRPPKPDLVVRDMFTSNHQRRIKEFPSRAEKASHMAPKHDVCTHNNYFWRLPSPSGRSFSQGREGDVRVGAGQLGARGRCAKSQAGSLGGVKCPGAVSHLRMPRMALEIPQQSRFDLRRGSRSRRSIRSVVLRGLFYWLWFCHVIRAWQVWYGHRALVCQRSQFRIRDQISQIRNDTTVG